MATPVQQFYEHTHVFITGGTGFLGKGLIEKLLRSCSIEKLYVLIREKNNKSGSARLNELLEDVVRIKSEVKPRNGILHGFYKNDRTELSHSHSHNLYHLSQSHILVFGEEK